MIKKLKNNSLIILSIIALFSLNTTNAQVGIGTTNPHASAILDLTSTTQGLLPPRMSDTQRDAIGTPPNGLIIYNTTEKCLQWYNGTGWFDACDGSTFVAPVLGSGFTNGFQNNNTCTTKVISVTPCSVVPGATLNDDTGTTDGTEYDWTDATSYMGGTTTRALVEIGGQCWFGRNTTAAPTAPCADPINTGCNTWLNTSPGDIGSWGYYNTATTNGSSGWATTEPAVGEGLLYQWSAAMNGVSGTAAERAQGVCPTGWHVPSDCEWMYLENTLGMSTTAQQATGFRTDGDVGGKLSTLTRETPASANGTGTNSSGFTALLAGYRATNGTFSDRGTLGHWWSSSVASTTHAQGRDLASSQAGVYRGSYNKPFGFSVRCLKD